MQCENLQEGFIPVDHIQDARSLKKKRQAFYTPLSLVKVMVQTANHWPSCRVLEPSAGDGRIVWELRQQGLNVDACELDEAMRARCEAMGANIVGDDFLKYQPAEPYDLIVMNPPFTNGQDKKHIEHAYSMLSQHGELVAISSPGLAEHLQKCTMDLPGCEYAVHERLGKDVFKESGTGIETLLVTILKGKGEECTGFSNLATCNAALTIDSDQKLLNVCRMLRHPLDVRDQFSKSVAELGGSCYGVDWNEVYRYINGEIPEN